MATYRRIETPKKGPIHIYQSDEFEPANYALTIFLHGFCLGKKKESWYVDQAWDEFDLRNQFDRANNSSMFVAVATKDGKGRPTYWKNLDELLDVLSKEMAQWVFEGERYEFEHVHVVGHSGAYANILHWLGHQDLCHITLLDGLYGGVTAFREWAQHPDHKNWLDLCVTRKTGTDRNAKKLLTKVPKYSTWTQLPGSVPEACNDTSQVLYVPLRMPHMKWVTGGEVLPLMFGRDEQVRYEFG